jgi:hypothetical protein
MPSKKHRPAPKSEKDELYEALLGSDEEMDDEEASEILAGHGINSSDLLLEFKSRVETDARRIQSNGKTIPVPMQNAIKNLRATIDSQKQEENSIDPAEHIESLLSGKAQAATNSAGRYSFRNRKAGEKISNNDRNLLDSLEDEVETKASQK